jgi:molybdopterin-containing oxidoreductase family iron-sulfur binding subunit
MHKHYWRSENELNKTAEFQSFQDREFPVDASVLETPVSRRSFIKLMGASMALAGLTGCNGIRRPTRHIYPYANMPEYQVPGRPNFYATSMAIGHQVNGLVAESFEGRPTKIEGNPDYPLNPDGSASVFNQASVIDLYDPDRLKTVRHRNEAATWEGFSAWWNRQSKTLKANHGAGLYILSTIQTGPTFYRVADQLKSQFPQATFLISEPVNADNVVTGVYSMTSQKAIPVLDFSGAKVIVSLDSDFLGVEGDTVPQIRTFAESRVPGKKMSRFYAIESRTGVTGAKADHRLRVKPSQIEAFTIVLAKALSQHVILPGQAALAPLFVQADALAHSFDSKFINALVEDLLKNRGRSVVTAGYNQPPSVHALVWAINSALGNTSGVRYYPVPFSDHAFNKQSSTDALITLQNALESKAVDTLIILDGDPAYTAPADLNLGARLALAKHVVHLTLRENATSRTAEWVLPQAHFLESWDDATASTGAISIIQPLISPLFFGKTPAELLTLLANTPQEDYDLVVATAKSNHTGGNFDAAWKSWLHKGVVSTGTSASMPSYSPTGLDTVLAESQKRVRKPNAGLEIAFYPDQKLYDGRYVNNGWLQETPETSTKLTWDNAAIVSRKTADALGVNTEDVITIKVNGRALDTAVFVLPGMPDDTLSIALGYGQSQVGRIGSDRGFNAYQIRTTQGLYMASGVTVSKTGKTYVLACTQDHWSMENRPLIREASLATYLAQPDFAKDMGEEVPHNRSSWNEHPYDTGYQWGLFIDLAKCTGCNACTIACQAENNIPIVGKDQVKKGREMHWIRVDRYFVGDTADAQMAFQPMTCLQCENAPCENVCPVAATTHSTEGLNDMTYNRCVGTRYCSNNCPTKVRRFNFFDYHQRNPEAKPKDREHWFDAVKTPDKLMQMQFNPDVTVRMRGVMEKCTYCVQRINQGKFAAKLQNRTIQDGEIKTACQQTCPANAITFGNIRDENSAVYKLRNDSRNYSILESLLLKARTTYGAAVRNPNDRLEVMAKTATEHGGHHS